MNLQSYVDQSHADNSKWWVDIETGMPLRRDKAQLLLLINTEIAEAVEGLRKDLWDDHLPHRKMFEVELADALIRIFDFCGGFGINLDKEVFAYFGTHHWSDLNDLVRKDNTSLFVLLIDSMSWVCKAWNSYSDGYGEHIGESVFMAIVNILGAGQIARCDLEAAYQEKRLFNLKRSDHKHEHRRNPHGKKF